jgi:hypothetical protein
VLKVSFEINGRQVTAEKAGDALKAAFLAAVEDGVRKKLSGIRDPNTGEFPVVSVRGRDLDNLSFEVSGSPKLMALAQSAFKSNIEETDMSDTSKRTPCAFLCHSSKDKALALRIATDFRNNGLETFIDKWEIQPGDSIRRKIDEGLEACTHFVALLTPLSIDAPWVQTEMDAAFMRKVEGKCKFIPLRSDLSADALPPLLRGIYSPALTDYDDDVQALISAIHGLGQKPPLGAPPAAIGRSSKAETGLSPAAELIARLIIEKSEHGEQLDPQWAGEEVTKLTGLGVDDIVDAVDELDGRGLVHKIVTIGCGQLHFSYIGPEARLFSELDQHFMAWDPAKDALRLAAELVNGAEGRSIPAMAETLGWAPRRMNPAANWLIARDLVDSSQACGTHPWTTHWIGKSPKTRRFVRDRS